MLAACTPISSRQDDPAPLRAGDRLPDVGLVTAEGLATDLGEARRGPLVLTFLRPYGDPRSEIARELVGRLERSREALRDDVAARTRYTILLLDDPGGAPLPGWLPRGRDWDIAVGPQAPIRTLAERLGVLLWDGTPDLPGQTFVTVIVAADGTISDRLTGLESWSIADLVGTIVGAY